MKPGLDLLLEAAVADHQAHELNLTCHLCERTTPPGAPRAYLGTFNAAGLKRHMLQVHGLVEARS